MSGIASPPTLPLSEWLLALPALPLSSIELTTTFPRPLHLGAPLSAVVRGLLGERLRDLRCITRAPQCDGCTEAPQCDYDAVFGRKDQHPYWLQGLSADRAIPAGSAVTARIVVTRAAAPVLAYLDVALRDALSHLGSPESSGRRGGLAVSGSRRENLVFPTTTHPHRTLRIVATSPLILRGDDQVSVAACPQAPWLALLVRAGVRRLDALLRGDTTDAVLPRVYFPDMRSIEVVDGRLTPWRASRFSVRQGLRYPLSGLTGAVTVRGDAMAAIGPLLQALTLTNVGKATTMGFGSLRVEPVS